MIKSKKSAIDDDGNYVTKIKCILSPFSLIKVIVPDEKDHCFLEIENESFPSLQTKVFIHFLEFLTFPRAHISNYNEEDDSQNLTFATTLSNCIT